jgi:hypothetical protein
MSDEDWQNLKGVTRETANLSSAVSKGIRAIPINKPRMDLSKLSNKELQDRINRENLEKQYDSMFNSDRARAERGRDTVAAIIEGIGTIATVGTAAIGLATAIKKFRAG